MTTFHQLNVLEVVHYFNIKVYKKKPGEIIEHLSWSGLIWEVRLKYNWYFLYRAALLQVKYPKHIIETTWGHEPAQGKTKEYLAKKKISSQKAQITKHQNKLEIFKKEFEDFKTNYLKIFPIEEDETYIRFENSIALAESKIQKLKNELKDI